MTHKSLTSNTSAIHSAQGRYNNRKSALQNSSFCFNDNVNKEQKSSTI